MAGEQSGTAGSIWRITPESLAARAAAFYGSLRPGEPGLARTAAAASPFGAARCAEGSRSVLGRASFRVPSGCPSRAQCRRSDPSKRDRKASRSEHAEGPESVRLRVQRSRPKSRARFAARRESRDSKGLGAPVRPDSRHRGRAATGRPARHSKVAFFTCAAPSWASRASGPKRPSQGSVTVSMEDSPLPRSVCSESTRIWIPACARIACASATKAGAW
jgi:hypothetical protein